MAWEKLGTASVGGGAAENTSWKELARGTLGSSNATLTSGTFTAKENLMVLIYGTGGTSSQIKQVRFNSDSGNNYSYRRSDAGAADGTSTSQAQLHFNDKNNNGSLTIGEIVNISNQEKLSIWDYGAARFTGDSQSVQRMELVGKWANTSSQITSVQAVLSGGSSWDSGSEIIVLGMDNDEADSGTNFWQQLLDESGTGNMSTSTWAAKKYLMFDIHMVSAGSRSAPAFRWNNDSGTNYVYRWSDEGSSDSSATDSSYMGFNDTMPANGYNHIRGFALNISDKEKLIHTQSVSNEADTNGATTVIDRRESFQKWVNTSAQITSLTSFQNTGTNSTWRIKVWGSD